MIQIFSLPNCTNCVAAKNLAKSKDVEFEELNLMDDTVRSDLEKQIGKLPRTAPVIVEDGVLVGGLDEFRDWIANNTEAW